MRVYLMEASVGSVRGLATHAARMGLAEAAVASNT